MQLNHSIAVLKGMGPKTATIFNNHGINTVEDLCYFFPRGWIDATTVREIKDLRGGVSALIHVRVVMAKPGMSQRTRKPYLRATVADASGSLDVVWFYANYLKQKVKPGAEFMLYGKVQTRYGQPPVMMSPKFITEPSIIPVYPEIGGLASQKVVALTKQIVPAMADIEDFLPSELVAEHRLLPLAEAVRMLHFPDRVNDIPEAQKRLGFNELLMLMVPSLMNQKERAQEKTDALVGDAGKISGWLGTLPFQPTPDQTKVIHEVLGDMAETKPMNRLVQGDVGSGKTVVGLAAAYQAVLHGKQAVWLAPTELLAKQHFATAQQLLAGLPVSLGLWTRTQHAIPGKDKVKSEEVLAQDLIIGTHALLSESLTFQNLGLLIIDEQHRFGVKQRAHLRHFGGKQVHLLSMTATPIPRTMALLIYGDLQLSTIKEKPLGRKPVVTKVVDPNNRKSAYDYVETLVAKGYQAFVVCPTIEPAEDDEANIMNQLFQTIEEKKSVVRWYEELKQLFPQRRLGMLHGKLKAPEKEQIMTAFRSGEIDMLVTTTVIEVGVDVSNANIMIIESAERFGLAQLHQLRGRVGRSEQQALCLLFPSSVDKQDNERLKIMEASDDGFVLAEKDLQLRGPGELTGLAQSGIPPLRFASLQDADQIARVQSVAHELVNNPQFASSLQRFWRLHHPE